LLYAESEMVLSQIEDFLAKLVSDSLLLVQSLVIGQGIVGQLAAFAVVLVVSIVGNATILFPAPVILLVFGAGVFAAQYQLGVGFAVLMGIAGGLGAAIGELSSFFVGYLGRRGLRQFSASIDNRLLADLQERIKQHGNWAVFLGAVSPLPFDVIGLAAGALQMDVKKFFVATALGKIIRDVVIALAGYYGVEILKSIFGL
jgi:membrane protein DedA with SNARE-associated domain